MKCPYYDLPDSSRWEKAISSLALRDINPHVSSLLRVGPRSKIASAGSCFAQNITKALLMRGYNYYVAESAPKFLSTIEAQQLSYGTFSARYGNIYTSLQLLQLIKRAFDGLVPIDQIWRRSDGRYFDLLRPRIMPNGFSSMEEIEADIRRHLSCVRQLFQEVDIFIFTLGLTEGWQSTEDGLSYPTCPGCGSAGDFSAEKYIFKNYSVGENSSALGEALEKLNKLNENIQIILTVSPVSLMATMEPTHILQASTYSKSVLRVAAEDVVKNFNFVHYFAAYEIITGTTNTQAYFSQDRRNVTQDGIDHVMECFFECYGSGEETLGSNTDVVTAKQQIEQASNMQGNSVCDEEEFFRAISARSGS